MCRSVTRIIQIINIYKYIYIYIFKGPVNGYLRTFVNRLFKESFNITFMKNIKNYHENIKSNKKN